MIKRKIFFYIEIILIFFLLKTECVDIKMSLGKKLDKKNNIYPLFIILNEPLIQSDENKSLNLFLIYEVNKNENYLELLNNTLNAILPKLNKKRFFLFFLFNIFDR